MIQEQELYNINIIILAIVTADMLRSKYKLTYSKLN